MRIKYTPGKWRLAPDNTVWVGDVMIAATNAKDQEANGTLIAGAPELAEAAYEALEAVDGIDDMAEFNKRMKRLRKALRQAGVR